MAYALIDPIVDEWAKRHSLHVNRLYQEVEVRSVEWVSGIGERFQIWIDQPSGAQLEIHAWDYDRRKQNWKCEIGRLADTLEQALCTVQSWKLLLN